MDFNGNSVEQPEQPLDLLRDLDPMKPSTAGQTPETLNDGDLLGLSSGDVPVENGDPLDASSGLSVDMAALSNGLDCLSGLGESQPEGSLAMSFQSQRDLGAILGDSVDSGPQEVQSPPPVDNNPVESPPVDGTEMNAAQEQQNGANVVEESNVFDQDLSQVPNEDAPENAESAHESSVAVADLVSPEGWSETNVVSEPPLIDLPAPEAPPPAQGEADVTSPDELPIAPAPDSGASAESDLFPIQADADNMDHPPMSDQGPVGEVASEQTDDFSIPENPQFETEGSENVMELKESGEEAMPAAHEPAIETPADSELPETVTTSNDGSPKMNTDLPDTVDLPGFGIDPQSSSDQPVDTQTNDLAESVNSEASTTEINSGVESPPPPPSDETAANSIDADVSLSPVSNGQEVPTVEDVDSGIELQSAAPEPPLQTPANEDKTGKNTLISSLEQFERDEALALASLDEVSGTVPQQPKGVSESKKSQEASPPKKKPTTQTKASTVAKSDARKPTGKPEPPKSANQPGAKKAPTRPSVEPVKKPSVEPVKKPSVEPVKKPSVDPVKRPTGRPSSSDATRRKPAANPETKSEALSKTSRPSSTDTAKTRAKPEAKPPAAKKPAVPKAAEVASTKTRAAMPTAKPALSKPPEVKPSVRKPVGSVSASASGPVRPTTATTRTSLPDRPAALSSRNALPAKTPHSQIRPKTAPSGEKKERPLSGVLTTKPEKPAAKPRSSSASKLAASSPSPLKGKSPGSSEAGIPRSPSGPNLKAASSKVGSLANATHVPKGGEKKVESQKLDFKAKATSRIGSLVNVKHKPAGGNVKILNDKLDFKAKAAAKVPFNENAAHSPGGGKVRIFDDPVKVEASSKVGSLENANHQPGGGNVSIINKSLDFSDVGPRIDDSPVDGSGVRSPGSADEQPVNIQ